MLRAWWKKCWEMNQWLPLATACLALVTLAFFFYVNLWLAPAVEDMKSRMTWRQEFLSRSTGSDAVTRRSLHEGREQLKAFWAMVPPRAAFSELISDISQLAKMAHLTVDRIQYFPQNIPERKLLRYGLDFTVDGNYPEVKKFIYLIEQSSRILTIDTVSFQGRSESRASGVVMKIRLSTFFRQ